MEKICTLLPNHVVVSSGAMNFCSCGKYNKSLACLLLEHSRELGVEFQTDIEETLKYGNVPYDLDRFILRSSFSTAPDDRKEICQIEQKDCQDFVKSQIKGGFWPDLEDLTWDQIRSVEESYDIEAICYVESDSHCCLGVKITNEYMACIESQDGCLVLETREIISSDYSVRPIQGPFHLMVDLVKRLMDIPSPDRTGGLIMGKVKYLLYQRVVLHFWDDHDAIPVMNSCGSLVCMTVKSVRPKDFLMRTLLTSGAVELNASYEDFKTHHRPRKSQLWVVSGSRRVVIQMAEDYQLQVLYHVPQNEPIPPGAMKLTEDFKLDSRKPCMISCEGLRIHLSRGVIQCRTCGTEEKVNTSGSCGHYHMMKPPPVVKCKTCRGHLSYQSVKMDTHVIGIPVNVTFIDPLKKIIRLFPKDVVCSSCKKGIAIKVGKAFDTNGLVFWDQKKVLTSESALDVQTKQVSFMKSVKDEIRKITQAIPRITDMILKVRVHCEGSTYDVRLRDAPDKPMTVPDDRLEMLMKAGGPIISGKRKGFIIRLNCIAMNWKERLQELFDNLELECPKVTLVTHEPDPQAYREIMSETSREMEKKVLDTLRPIQKCARCREDPRLSHDGIMHFSDPDQSSVPIKEPSQGELTYFFGRQCGSPFSEPVSLSVMDVNGDRVEKMRVGRKIEKGLTDVSAVWSDREIYDPMTSNSHRFNAAGLPGLMSDFGYTFTNQKGNHKGKQDMSNVHALMIANSDEVVRHLEGYCHERCRLLIFCPESCDGSHLRSFI